MTNVEIISWTGSVFKEICAAINSWPSSNLLCSFLNASSVEYFHPLGDSQISTAMKGMVNIANTSVQVNRGTHLCLNCLYRGGGAVDGCTM